MPVPCPRQRGAMSCGLRGLDRARAGGVALRLRANWDYPSSDADTNGIAPGFFRRRLHKSRSRRQTPLSCSRGLATCPVCRVPCPMSAAREPAIAVDQLVKLYKTTRAVDGISFALEQGSITGLLGGNGAGKTTTIAMMLGLVLPTSGTVKVLGAQMPRQRYQV